MNNAKYQLHRPARYNGKSSGGLVATTAARVDTRSGAVQAPPRGVSGPPAPARAPEATGAPQDQALAALQPMRKSPLVLILTQVVIDSVALLAALVLAYKLR